jgi:hypothetical protein
MNHYVYRITCLITNKHYYGVRSCEADPCLDLGKKYKSSSNVVLMSIMLYGAEKHKFKIVRKFKTRMDAMLFECFLHEKFNVDLNPKFMNKARNRTTRAYFSAPGNQNPCWGKRMMFLERDVIFVKPEEINLYKERGYVLGRPEWLKNYGRKGKLNSFYGKKHSNETKILLRKKRSKPIKVFMTDGRTIELGSRLELGSVLNMSASLGASLVTRKRQHLFKKYGIESIEVIGENILHKED